MSPDDESSQSANKEPGQEERYLPLMFRRLAEENAESIGRGLVEKASAGNYNAAHLLLELGGIGPFDKGRSDAEPEGKEPRIFLLDLIDRLLLWDETSEDRNATDKTTKAGR